jgi:hypothetical protein
MLSTFTQEKVDLKYLCFPILIFLAFFLLRRFKDLASQFNIHYVTLIENEKGKGLETTQNLLRGQIVFEIPDYLALAFEKDDPAASLLLATTLIQSVDEDENGFWAKLHFFSFSFGYGLERRISGKKKKTAVGEGRTNR